MQRKLTTHCHFKRQPLKAPLGFKGSYLRELWQVAASLENADGQQGIGLGVQRADLSVLRVLFEVPVEEQIHQNRNVSGAANPSMG